MDWLRQLPIGQYVHGSGSWLRQLDPRLKLAWTVAFLVTPILAGPIWRLALVALLLLLTAVSGLPPRLWARGVGLLLAVAVALGVLAAVLPVGAGPPAPLQRPPAELRLLPGPPQSPAPTAAGAAWELWRFGPLQVTRRSLELGINGGTLLFTLVHSANVMLLTTPPEQLVWAISWCMAPLARLGLPATRLGFMVLLALRFLPLVQEEFQNLLRAVATRAVVLKRLGWKGALGLVLAVGERLLANVLLRAEQGADALVARGGLMLDPMQLPQRGTWAGRLNAGALIALLLLVLLRWKVGDL
ncbi:MAG: energy-coupling factor transporter transmembrane protein EcfT [Cyanobacteria bacterium K_DeepCast_35m_m2_023]|nr:energy-coupling factor transporter transmembrane protein EcfT [Cyanobacteria bacterium K_DeepCast_35m_m2_023]